MGDYLSDLVMKNTGTADVIQPRLAARFEPYGIQESSLETEIDTDAVTGAATGAETGSQSLYREQAGEAAARAGLGSLSEIKPDETDEIRTGRKSPDEKVIPRPPVRPKETPIPETTEITRTHQPGNRSDARTEPTVLPEAGRAEMIAGETAPVADQSGAIEVSAREEFQVNFQARHPTDPDQENPDEKIQPAAGFPRIELSFETEQAARAENQPAPDLPQNVKDPGSIGAAHPANKSPVETKAFIPAKEIKQGQKDDAAASLPALEGGIVPVSVTVVTAPPAAAQTPGTPPDAIAAREDPDRKANAATTSDFRTAPEKTGEFKIHREEEIFPAQAERDVKKRPEVIVKPRADTTKKRAGERVFDRDDNTLSRGRAGGQISNGAEISEVPTINVSIGRVEVRAVTSSTTPPAETHAKIMPLSLDEYLQKRRAGGEK